MSRADLVPERAKASAASMAGQRGPPARSAWSEHPLRSLQGLRRDGHAQLVRDPLVDDDLGARHQRRPGAPAFSPRVSRLTSSPTLWPMDANSGLLPTSAPSFTIDALELYTGLPARTAACDHETPGRLAHEHRVGQDPERVHRLRALQQVADRRRHGRQRRPPGAPRSRAAGRPRPSARSSSACPAALPRRRSRRCAGLGVDGAEGHELVARRAGRRRRRRRSGPSSSAEVGRVLDHAVHERHLGGHLARGCAASGPMATTIAALPFSDAKSRSPSAAAARAGRTSWTLWPLADRRSIASTAGRQAGTSLLWTTAISAAVAGRGAKSPAASGGEEDSLPLACCLEPHLQRELHLARRQRLLVETVSRAPGGVRAAGWSGNAPAPKTVVELHVVRRCRRR